MKYNEKGQITNSVPVSRGILEHLEKKLSINQFTILLYLILRADYRFGYCITSSGELASRTQLSREVIRKALRELGNNGYIKQFFTNPHKMYEILIHKYPTDKGEVNIHGTESIRCIQYVKRSQNNAVASIPASNNQPEAMAISDDEKSKAASINLLRDNNVQGEAHNPFFGKNGVLENAHGSVAGLNPGFKVASIPASNKYADTWAVTQKRKSMLASMKIENRQAPKEEEKKKEIKEDKREEGRFFDKSKNLTLTMKIPKNMDKYFQFEGTWYRKDEYRVDEKNWLINLDNDYDNPEHLMTMNDLSGRPKIKRCLIDTEKNFFHCGTAYDKRRWYLDDDFLDLPTTVKPRKDFKG